MKKQNPDSSSSMNEKPKTSSAHVKENFGGNHGGRGDIQSKAGEENLTPPVTNNFTKGVPKSRT